MLTNRTKRQGFVRLISPQVEAIDQPVEFLAVERHCVGFKVARPFEALLLKAFVPEYEAILFPQQNLKLVTLAINEHIQRGLKRVQRQRLLHQQ